MTPMVRIMNTVLYRAVGPYEFTVFKVLHTEGTAFMGRLSTRGFTSNTQLKSDANAALKDSVQAAIDRELETQEALNKLLGETSEAI